MKNEKRRMKKDNIYLLILCVLCILCIKISGCVSLVEMTGKVLDGSNEKIIEKYQGENGINVYKVKNKKNEESILITVNSFPMMKFRTSLPDENGIININSLEYFASNIHGWNEYTMIVLGTGSFTSAEDIKLEITNEIDHIQITSGKIHRFDTRITGDEALTALSNRHERILSLTEWMLAFPEKPDIFVSNDHFINYWEPVLFPEITSKRKRPKNWQLKGDNFQRGEDIKWNTSYSRRVFPEELWPVRDTGTLLRDWEEALPWIYMEYHREYIVELLSKENKLKKAR